MRGKVGQLEKDEDRYGYIKQAGSLFSEKRLNLKDLLKRAEEKKKRDKKI